MSCLRIVYKSVTSAGDRLGIDFILGTSILGVTVTASSEVGDMVAENLTNSFKSRIWRASTTSAILTIELGNPTTIRCVALPFTNLTNAATMRVRGYTLITDVVAVFDTTALPCCPYSSREAFGWDTNMPGLATFTRGGGVYASLFFTGASVSKLVIDLADSTNPLGYIEAASLLVGDYWEPLYGTPRSIQMGYEDTSINTRSASGDMLSEIQPLNKKMTFPLTTFTEDDRQTLMRILRNNSKTHPLYISAMTGLGENLEQEYQIYGKLTDNQLLTLQNITKFNSTITISEV
jgi:hypothetical protein